MMTPVQAATYISQTYVCNLFYVVSSKVHLVIRFIRKYCNNIFEIRGGKQNVYVCVL